MDYTIDADVAAAETMADPAADKASAEFLGRWNRLVSATNWEKGRIICEWRQALAAAGAPAQGATDEAWSRRVGNLTPQHAGRLRRVYQRFGAVREQYAGLYWSHFQVALEWSDAEMWLEGAVQNSWSVAQMQRQRGETLGAVADDAADLTAAAAEVDEDAAIAPNEPPVVSSTLGEVRGVDDSPGGAADAAADGAAEAEDFFAPADEPAAPLRPFEDLPLLPADMQEAFEAFKLAIVRQRQAGWPEISPEQVSAALAALQAFARAPA
jgi:hypothetical protein